MSSHGLAVSEALLAYAQGRYEDAVTLLLPVQCVVLLRAI
jgi:hypothetical protein